MSNDPRITELLELANAEGQPLALQPETICALEDAGWFCDPFTAQLFREEPARPPMVALDGLVSALHGLGNVLCLALLLVSLACSLAPTTAQAARPAPVRRCPIVHGVRVCLPVTGGSGITPVLRR